MAQRCALWDLDDLSRDVCVSRHGAAPCCHRGDARGAVRTPSICPSDVACGRWFGSLYIYCINTECYKIKCLVDVCIILNTLLALQRQKLC